MKKLLQIKSSLFSGNGQSSQLSDKFVASWQAAHPGSSVLVRDLGQAQIPHLTAERFGAFLSRPEERNAAQQEVIDFSDALIAELRDADVIVLGLPLYNFGIPSTLKAYFDHIARAGVTFRYTENGPVGLLTGKKVYVLAARGGKYQGTPLDTQTGYVRDFLRFIGLSDVEFVYAEGLNLGEEARQGALGNAHATIESLFAPERAAA